jgi:hypothetical protein
MGTKRGFWRSRPAIAEEVENGTPISIEARRPHRVIGHGVGMALVAIRDCGLTGFQVLRLANVD